MWKTLINLIVLKFVCSKIKEYIMSDRKHSLKKSISSSNSISRASSPRLKVDSIRKKQRTFNVRIEDIRSKIEKEDKISLALVSSKEIKKTVTPPIVPDQFVDEEEENSEVDGGKRMFLKLAGVAGLGMAASAILPKTADAYVAGSTPTSNVVGLKDDSNTRINPATEETVSNLLTGQSVVKISTNLSSSGTVHTPASGKKIRVYASRFSLTADATSVSFRFTAGGTDYEKYLSPKTGGLYGSNNHPNYVEGGVDEVLYCNISGTTNVQINIDYLEV